jgi:hypothetical protein
MLQMALQHSTLLSLKNVQKSQHAYLVKLRLQCLSLLYIQKNQMKCHL